jgi:hypothetical protein
LAGSATISIFKASITIASKLRPKICRNCHRKKEGNAGDSQALERETFLQPRFESSAKTLLLEAACSLPFLTIPSISTQSMNIQ